MRRIFIILSLICILLHCERVYSSVWIPIGSEEQGDCLTITVLRNDASSYQIEVVVNGLYDDQITNIQGIFHRLSLGMGGMSLCSGEPVLPLITRMIAIPTERIPNYSIVEEQWADVEVGTIFPAQIPPRDSKERNSFYMNKQAYSKPFIPTLVSQSEEQTWRGIRNVVVSVCPFKYYPTENRLSVLKKFVLEVDFEPTGSLADAAVSYEVNDFYGLFDNTIYSLPNRSQNTNTDDPTYLVICKDSEIRNSQSMTEFLRWKALKGFNTKIVLLDSILSVPSYYSQEEVKAYIRNQVESGGFVLLVGDNNKIPMAETPSFYYNTGTYSGLIKGDYWYGCGTGTNDWMADIAVGRFSVSNLNEFSRIVRRIVKYESTSPLTNNTLLIAHKENPYNVWGYQHWCENICNGDFAEPMAFVTAYGAEGATNADVVMYLNSGVPIACYVGHGYASYWGGVGGTPEDPYSGWNIYGESFYSSQASNLNDSVCAVIFSNCPRSANISANDNMLEAFMRGQKGTTAFVGYTGDGDSYGDFNVTYSYDLFSQMLNQGNYLLGSITNAAHIFNAEKRFNSSGLAKDYCYSSVCGGDPALEFWTATPQAFGDVTLTEGTSTIMITTQDSGCKICVAGENGNLIGVYSVTSDNTCTFPRPSGNFYIGINKHNFIPHIIKYDVTTDAVQNETITIDSYYHYTPIGFGDGVSLDVPDGPVIVKSGTKLIIKNGTGGVRLIEGFECEKGAILEVK